MQAREYLLEELIENVSEMVESIEERESMEPDFGLVRELAEQLKEELQSLQEQ